MWLQRLIRVLLTLTCAAGVGIILVGCGQVQISVMMEQDGPVLERLEERITQLGPPVSGAWLFFGDPSAEAGTIHVTVYTELDEGEQINATVLQQVLAVLAAEESLQKYLYFKMGFYDNSQEKLLRTAEAAATLGAEQREITSRATLLIRVERVLELAG